MPDPEAPQAQMSKDTERALRALNKHRICVESEIAAIRKDVESGANDPEVMLSLIEPLLQSVTRFRTNETDSFDEEFPGSFSFGYGLYKLVIELKQKVIKSITAAGNSQLQAAVNPVSSQVSLPAINLPSFDGNYRDWFSFIDSFNSLIGNNGALSDLQKLQYLQSSLRGDAARTIQCLEITHANYQIALQLLTDNFENRRMIVNSHIQALFNLPQIQEETSLDYRNLINAVLQHTRSLESMNRAVHSTEDLLIHLVLMRCPQKLRIEWENKLTRSEMPKFKDLHEFLSKRCQTLESINSTKENPKINSAPATQAGIQSKSCILCSQGHYIFNCEKFRALEPNKRHEFARSKRLCLNCLKPGHNVMACKSTNHCKNCSKRHNTMLHFTPSQNQTPPSTSSYHVQNSNDVVLLSTCIIEVSDAHNNKHNVRALLDSGSELNLVTEQFIRKLNLSTHATNQMVTGIGASVHTTQKYVDLNINSKLTNFKSIIRCFTIKRITNQLPSQQINRKEIQLPKNIQLADPQFDKPSDIDLLLGAELFYQLIQADRIAMNENKLTLQNTLMGWIISGRVPQVQRSTILNCYSVTYSELNSNIKRFWEIENAEIETAQKTQDEDRCQRMFRERVQRDLDGRFIVAFPWKTDASALGKSYGIAKKRFYNLERKLDRNPQLRLEYNTFMDEYIKLGHMKRVQCTTNFGYFLPHHCVIKESSTTTKLRVVFDASAKSDKGNSLNDLLLTGPTLQEDLFDILVRFRSHEYVVTADVQMMFRQIKISEGDRPFQQILWRSSPDQPINRYQLQTVTYGTCCAPFLAVRCLQELANEAPDPLTAIVIGRDFYMDDVLTGAPTITVARNLCKSLAETLGRGGFPLRKWAANSEHILKDFDNTQILNHVLNLAPDNQIKTLGVNWNPVNDQIEYSAFNFNSESTTKREILSEIARYFDPLGLMGPVVILAKLLLQRIWKLNLKWDEHVPRDILASWLQLRAELKTMKSIRVARKAKSAPNAKTEIHAFGDASMQAYGAAVYLKSIEPSGVATCTLLCAKSRVAPLKTITLPRLELCAAVLTANLVERVKKALRGETSTYYFYSDSTIVLSWLQSEAGKFKQFVSNRVTEIQKLTDVTRWQHVSSGDNPADIISRGVYPSGLINNKLWWEGPEFLKGEITMKQFAPYFSQEAELRTLLATETVSIPNIPWMYKFSKLNKLIRVTAWVQRFKNNCLNKTRNEGELTPTELEMAEIILVRAAQMVAFSKDIQLLENNHQTHPQNTLAQLNPFLDEFGVIRVGGRLRYSKLQFDSKCPIVLPKSCFLAELIARHHHIKGGHVGSQGTLASIRTRYWPISGRNLVRRTTRECVTCFKANPRSTEPIMANLPEYRSEQLRPFIKTGMDYGGPFLIKETKRKTAKFVKVYMALFICMSTKAIHLEIVLDLTTESFLAALRRFISRRGLVTDLYSDNATTFVGANNEITKLYTFLEEQQYQIKAELSADRIHWHFIPPRAPHFGGLWEAGIKAAKRHLYRMAGSASLTYEEFWTLLVQIEGILNSRPLCPLSNDPNDLSFLTPGHFLVGGNLRALPEPNLEHIKIGRLSRWQLVQRIQQQFWSRWHKEYLQELQIRHKWKQTRDQPLEVGLLVLIHEDNKHPNQWRAGRIEAVHPGMDGVIRAATIKTARDSVVRPTVKLCVFPLEQGLNENSI